MSKSSQTDAAGTQMHRVTLLKAHTDNGIDHAKGASIEVDAITARWLAEHKVIDAASPPPAPAHEETR